MKSAPTMPPLPGRPLAALAGRDTSGVAPVAQRTLPHETVSLHAPSWLLGFVAFEIVCQLVLVSPWGERARVLVRSGAFAGSFLLLFVLRRAGGDSHPAWRWAMVSVFLVVLSILHPDTNGISAGVASASMYLAVFAPIFWVPRIRVDIRTVRQVFVLLWTFSAASAVLGALQVYFPGRFQPAISSAIAADEGYLGALQIQLANGTRVLRPMGLTNIPGGAAVGAMYTIVLGISLLMDRRPAWVRVLVFGGIVSALFTLYLSQVRALVVMTSISLLALGAPFAAQRRVGRFAVFALLSLGVAALVFLLAVSVGGESVTGRLSTLIEDQPGTVYYNNRGIVLEYTFAQLLPEYPLGAGLGRWGMLNSYFGDRLNSSPGLWAEIQWTGWLFDGGLPLMVASAASLWVALRTALRIASREEGASGEALQRWATVAFGYSVGIIALTFNAAVFQSALGIDFWLVNATVFAASRQIHGAMERV
jgi:hypothetical protein